MADYIKMVRAYGDILIDFYYLSKYGVKTTAYGPTAMYVPTIPNILFTLQMGIAKVYIKNP